MSVLVVTSQGAYRVRGWETWRTSALVIARLVDEWTQAPPPVVSVRSLTPRAAAHVTEGYLVVTGLPEVAFPQLAASAQTVSVRVQRPGGPAETLDITVPAGTALPYRAPDQPVSSTTIALAGRVTDAVHPHAPIAGATLVFEGSAAALAALTTPLAGGHDAGTAVQVRSLTADASTTLAAPAKAGNLALALGSTSGIASGRVLRLRAPGLGDDYVVVDTVLPGKLVTLTLPLRTTPDPTASVTRMNLGAAGASTTLRRSARPGDGVLLTQATLTDAVLEVVDGTATEYRATGLTADADGRWRLSGVRGVSDIVLTVAAAGYQTSGPTAYPLAPVDPTVVNTALST